MGPRNGTLSFRFLADGRVVMTDADGPQTGTYAVVGNMVMLSFNSGAVVYCGTVTGQTLAGMARNGARFWNFAVSLTM